MPHTRNSGRKWGFVPSLLALSPVLLGVPIFSTWKHYALPEPIQDLYTPTNTPQLSERAILAHAEHLSANIGFRTVGTREHAQGDAWMYEQALALQRMCEEAVEREPGRKLMCEVWRQEGSGSHRFDILHARLYKTYVNLTNIVLRISSTPSSREHAVLVNSHLDSTLPSPGAADDAFAVGVMIEVARNLIERRGWEPEWAVVMLWNNAEESLQDGSHLFSTQHPIAPTIRAMINLEAAGTLGPELLFQATSQQMIEAYSHVPRPYGTILANDVFSSGIILSDTDFRQFEQYLNITGLDMAIVGNSYFYHTRKDLVEYIEPGAAQHMAENTLALLLHLSSPASPLPQLTTGYTRPTEVFFSLLNSVFVQFSFKTANAMYAITLVTSVIFVLVTGASGLDVGGRSKGVNKSKGKGKSGGAKSEANGTGTGTGNGEVKKQVRFVQSGDGLWGEQAKGIGIVAASFLGAVIGANGVALLMTKGLNKGMSWYASEYSCALLYGPAALTGALVPHLLSRHTRERTVLTSLLLSHSLLAVIVQSVFSIGSAVVFFLSAAPLVIALTIDALVCSRAGAGEGAVWLGTYALGQFAPLLFGTEVFVAIADIFVPLTGRMGADAPAEFIIASMVALISSYTFALVIPFCHRFGKRFLHRALGFSFLATVLSVAIFSLRTPYDFMHPKRLYIIHSENITNNEVHLHMASADGAPGFETLVQDIAKFVGGENAQHESVDMNLYASDWDALFPFSAFLEPYKLQLESYVSPWAAETGGFSVSADNDIVNLSAGTRSLTIVVRHPGIIWTTIAFDAYVLAWSLDDSPPQEHARHHIKEASFYGVDTWTVDLVIKLPPDGGLKVNFVGVQEKAMWPGKQAEKALGGQAMKVLEELDNYLEEHTGGMVDATLLGCVGGVVVI
ncbi:hypothetical protein BD410DRAFT_741807 [Rickenella mellea]|uniref:Peptide hydrolase n=1 Tax=Rickenella mellea TaxID=50990 RepID=A0A4Y7QHB4_9AGAM|nr:hypothetical protein BD410DRAFT_741807 [Rickenella mellea]